MPIILLSTSISASPDVVFDLARSIDAHVASTGGTSERPVAGVMSGLIGLNESVTWEAKHFGVKQRLSVRITSLERPKFFEDQMVSGAFKRMKHRHDFRPTKEGTNMIDTFDFTAPLGIFGRIAEILFLSRYMRRFLLKRASELKRIAESSEYKQYIPIA